MSILGYNKNEKLEFNYKKLGGLWLIIISIIIAMATLMGGKQIINMQVFSIGYAISFLQSIQIKKFLINFLLENRRSFKIK